MGPPLLADAKGSKPSHPPKTKVPPRIGRTTPHNNESDSFCPPHSPKPQRPFLVEHPPPCPFPTPGAGGKGEIKIVVVVQGGSDGEGRLGIS